MNNIWRLVLLGIAGLVLAGTAIGVVAAQDGGDATETPAPTEDSETPPDADTEEVPSDKETRIDDYLARLAENLGISQDDLEAALKQTALEVVDEKVAEGALTEEQATEIRERIESGEGPFFFGFGKGFHHGMDHGVGIGAKLDDLAEFLGVDIADIHEALQDGQTLAEVAEANGKAADELSAYLLGNLEERLAEAVENGRITQERADEILANAPERIDELINREGPFRPHRGPRGGFEGEFVPPLEDEAVPETSGIAF